MDLEYQRWIMNLECRAEEAREHEVDAIQAGDGYLQKNGLTWLAAYATQKRIRAFPDYQKKNDHPDWNSYGFVPGDKFEIEFFIPKDRRAEVMNRLSGNWDRSFYIESGSYTYKELLCEVLRQDVSIWETKGLLVIKFYEPAEEGIPLPTGCKVVAAPNTGSYLTIACDTKK